MCFQRIVYGGKQLDICLLYTSTISFSMREVTDRNKIPREHLAFQVSTMACCLCALIPFSSWTAYTVGLISEHGLTFADYTAAIPYMFYPLIIVITCILLDAGTVSYTHLDVYKRQSVFCS